MEKKIRIACEGKTVADISALEPFQGNLKSLSKTRYEKLKKLIIRLGFSEPFSVWRGPDKNFLLNGHQRHRVLTRMRAEGWEVPPLPVSIVEARDIKEAKEKVLSLTSQFGEITDEGLYEFMSEADLGMEDVQDFHFPEVDLGEFEEEFFKEGLPSDGSPYTDKIKAPIYEPKGERPDVETLVDKTKTQELLKQIVESELPETIQEFLKCAAQRHNVFNYERIAEYYAHAPKVVQELMEKSALVIIDFDKAIENGFVALTNDLNEAAREDE